MGHREDEDRLTGVVGEALRRWLGRARDKVMEPWRRFKLQPDPSGVYQEQGSWNAEVDTIMTTVGQIARNAWSEAVDVPPVSRHAFVMSQLAQTENFLVRIPDEVYNLVFAEITDAVNAGADNEQVADRVDRVLEYSGSERWPNRARTIAQTETTRAYGAGTLAGGLEQSRVTGRLLQKRWDTERDERVRVSHREVDGEVRDLGMPFYVDGVPLMFPGDPMGPPETVINCRCDLVIVNERGR
jgi:Phage Mu protein F like protein.